MPISLSKGQKVDLTKGNPGLEKLVFTFPFPEKTLIITKIQTPIVIILIISGLRPPLLLSALF